jgi:hypothetical protein
VHPDRDRLIAFAVDWVVGKTGWGVGDGTEEPAEVNACIAAAWLLSGGRRYGEYFETRRRPTQIFDTAADQQVTMWYEKWHDQASPYYFLRVQQQMDAQLFQEQLACVPESERAGLLKQLRDDVTVATAYNAWRAAKPPVSAREREEALWQEWPRERRKTL